MIVCTEGRLADTDSRQADRKKSIMVCEFLLGVGCKQNTLRGPVKKVLNLGL